MQQCVKPAWCHSQCFITLCTFSYCKDAPGNHLSLYTHFNVNPSVGIWHAQNNSFTQCSLQSDPTRVKVTVKWWVTHRTFTQEAFASRVMSSATFSWTFLVLRCAGAPIFSYWRWWLYVGPALKPVSDDAQRDVTVFDALGRILDWRHHDTMKRDVLVFDDLVWELVGKPNEWRWVMKNHFSIFLGSRWRLTTVQ